MPRAFTLTELLVVLAIAGILLMVLFQPHESAVTRRQIEDRIRTWRSSEAHDVKSDSDLICSEVDLAGTWSLRRHFDGSSLIIQKNPSGAYEVHFSTGGCEGGCKLERHGESRDGILTLDQPVAEYYSAVYQKLYAIRIADTDYLVPAPFVPAVEAALSSKDDSIVDEARFNRSVYRRAN